MLTEEHPVKNLHQTSEFIYAIKDTTTICKNWGKSGILELCDFLGPQGERTFHICSNGRCASKIQFLRKLNRESYL